MDRSSRISAVKLSSAGFLELSLVVLAADYDVEKEMRMDEEGRVISQRFIGL